jgi:hypothetical protein
MLILFTRFFEKNMLFIPKMKLKHLNYVEEKTIFRQNILFIKRNSRC